MIIEDLVRQVVPATGGYLVGFADLRGLLGNPLLRFSHGLSIARKLDDAIIASIRNGPNHDYLTHFDALNEELGSLAKSIERALSSNGIEALAILPTTNDAEADGEYLRTLRFHLSHKMVATRAGLGWIGKTDLLVTKEFGPRLRLVSVLFDAAVATPHRPIVRSRCGKCTRCVDACPAGAANGRLWDTTVERDDFYDPFKCREMARSLSQRELGKQISLCGICVSVCPIGKKKLMRTAD